MTIYNYLSVSLFQYNQKIQEISDFPLHLSNRRNLALLNLNGTIINVIANTCICFTISCQNDYCEKG